MVNHVAELGEWDSLYVTVGSAAGALIGLQFVVVTLIAERPSLRMMEAGASLLWCAFPGVRLTHQQLSGVSLGSVASRMNSRCAATTGSLRASI